MNLTEPQAGSDLGAVRAKAVPADDGTWRITGQKIFITFGEHDLAGNIIHLVLARVPGAPPGTKGISCFIVPKYLVNADGSLGARNDLRCVSIEHKLGIHASPTCVMSYGDAGGAIGYLIGEANQGMRYMFTMMNTARLSVGIQGLSTAERAYQDALRYAQERKQGRAVGTRAASTGAGTPAPIVEHPDVRRMLLTMKAYIEAMRALLYTNAVSIDLARHHHDQAEREARRELAELLTPIAKAWCTDLGVELTSIGLQVHGGMGYVEETGVAQYVRDSRIAPIYEGTNGIQAIDLVMRKVPMRGGGVVADLLAQLEALDRELAAAGPELAGVRSALANGVSALREATDWITSRGPAGPNDALAGATPYLRLFGLVIGGWLLARSALAASRLLRIASGSDATFLQDKIGTARFYAEQLLPQAPGLLPAVTAGAGPLFDVDLSQATLG
jgi:alkylation response protein AidB-like acyl-CoA dehydrogenase